MFDSLPIDVEPNQDFIKFISLQGDKKNFQNLQLLLSLEKDYPGIFIKVMSNFNKVKSFRETLDENGKPKRLSWEETLTKFYFMTKYIGVKKENEDIAEVFTGKGLSQEVFDMANELRQQAKKANIPEHILGHSVKEESILESIERIKKQTEEELVSGKEMIDELYDKQFTYEWLSKNDPHNAIMGLFCSCCGTITSCAYGKDIARASIIAPDVQNLVVRNSQGDIISKGTLYIDKKRGYAVFNDFELNERYRHHEAGIGRYNVEETSKDEQDREMIFKAFQRGLKAFIEEYDKQNPENPLKQVNIGMGYNRLKKQIERFKIATQRLTAPAEYKFQDAMANEQYILYKRTEKQIENGGQER